MGAVPQRRIKTMQLNVPTQSVSIDRTTGEPPPPPGAPPPPANARKDLLNATA